jgi:hypothetical protein
MHPPRVVGEIEMVPVDAAALADARAGEHVGQQRCPAGDVVAVAWTGLAVPQHAATDLADEHVGYVQLARERDGGRGGRADIADLLPGQSASLGLELGCGAKEVLNLDRFEKRARRRRLLQARLLERRDLGELAERLALPDDHLGPHRAPC